MTKRRCPKCNGLFYLDSGTARCPHCGKCVKAKDGPPTDTFWQQEMDDILSKFDLSTLSEPFIQFLVRAGVEFPTQAKGDDDD